MNTNHVFSNYSCNQKQQQTPNRRRHLHQRNPPPGAPRHVRRKEQTGTAIRREKRSAERAQERNLKIEGR